MSNKLTLPQSDQLAMSADEARMRVDAIRGAVISIRQHLYELWSRQGWKSLGYESWHACVQAEFNQSESYLYRQLEAAKVEREILPEEEQGRMPESQLRPFLQLPSGQRTEVFKEAKETAPEGKLTAKHIEQVVAKYQPAKPPRKQKSKPDQPAAEPSQSSKTELPAIPTPAATESADVPEPVLTPDLSLNLYMVTISSGTKFVIAASEDDIKFLDDPFPEITLVDMTRFQDLGLWHRVETLVPKPAQRPMAEPTVTPGPPPPPPLAKGQPSRQGMPRTQEEGAALLREMKAKLPNGS